MRFCIFEDNHSTNFLPLNYFRPVYHLRCGIFSLEERVRQFLPAKSLSFQTRPYLAPYVKELYPNFSVNNFPEEDTWFINGRVIADSNLLRELKSSNRELALVNGDEIVAAKVMGCNVRQITQSWTDTADPDLFGSLPRRSVPSTLLRYPWQLIHRNTEAIEKDFGHIKKLSRSNAIQGKICPGVHLINKKNMRIGKGAIVKPGAVLDADRGPILIDEGATIMPNAVIEGPAYIGKHSTVKIGAKLYHGSNIGEHCKVGGEIEAAIFQSYSNKQHEGFLGHAYLGSWVNIGADTNASDLKNNYSTVRVFLNGSQVDTGLQFLGLIMGDHSKTGINVMFDTGTIVGVACNIYGSGLPPKYIPSFSWGTGSSFERYDLEKSLATARIVMSRRDISVSKTYEQLYRHIQTLALMEKKP